MMSKYTARTSRFARNLAALIAGEFSDNKGRVVMRDMLVLMAQPAAAKEFEELFIEWHSICHSKQTISARLMRDQLRDETPFVVAGYLNEFADTVDQIVALATILRRAADLIKTYGWVQGSAGSFGSGFDLLGAVDQAITVLANGGENRYIFNQSHNLWLMAQQLLTEHLRTSMLVAWNDAPGRRAAEVIDVLTSCAAAATLVRL